METPTLTAVDLSPLVPEMTISPILAPIAFANDDDVSMMTLDEPESTDGDHPPATREDAAAATPSPVQVGTRKVSSRAMDGNGEFYSYNGRRCFKCMAVLDEYRGIWYLEGCSAVRALSFTSLFWLIGG